MFSDRASSAYLEARSLNLGTIQALFVLTQNLSELLRVSNGSLRGITLVHKPSLAEIPLEEPTEFLFNRRIAIYDHNSANLFICGQGQTQHVSKERISI